MVASIIKIRELEQVQKRHQSGQKPIRTIFDITLLCSESYGSSYDSSYSSDYSYDDDDDNSIEGVIIAITTIVLIVAATATVVQQLTTNEQAYDNFGVALCTSFDKYFSFIAKSIHAQGEPIPIGLALKACELREATETKFQEQESLGAKFTRIFTKQTNSTALCESLLNKKGPEGLFYSSFVAKPGNLLHGNECYHRKIIADMASKETESIKYLEDVPSDAAACLVKAAKSEGAQEISGDFVVDHLQSCAN